MEYHFCNILAKRAWPKSNYVETSDISKLRDICKVPGLYSLSFLMSLKQKESEREKETSLRNESDMTTKCNADSETYFFFMCYKGQNWHDDHSLNKFYRL